MPPAFAAVAVSPLARTFLDSLMTIVFIFDAPADRAAWFFRSGWREATDLQGRLAARYGTDPAWSERLTRHGQWVNSHEADLGITSAERARPSIATSRWPSGWWPNPGKMRSLTTDALRKAFLQFVNDWYYGMLSQDSHLSYMGLARRASVLHADQSDAVVESYRHQAVLSALTLYVALLSEIICIAALTYEATRIRRVWDHLRAYGGAAELCTERYDVLLAGV
jgi:hypothetical protein